MKQIEQSRFHDIVGEKCGEKFIATKTFWNMFSHGIERAFVHCFLYAVR